MAENTSTVIQEPKQQTKTTNMEKVAKAQMALEGTDISKADKPEALKEQEPTPSMSQQVVNSMYNTDGNFIPTTHKPEEVRRMEEADKKPQTGDTEPESSSGEDTAQAKDKDKESITKTTQQTTDATQGTESMQKSEDTETKTEDGKEPETKETEAPKTYKIKGKAFTEDQLIEASSSIISDEEHNTRMQEASKLINDNQARLNQAADIIDKDSVSQPFVTLLTSNTEALTEVKQILSEKFGDKGVKAFEDMAQFNAQTFRHPLKDELDKERATNTQNAADSKLNKDLSDFAISQNLTPDSKQQLDDYMVKVFADSGEKTILSPAQALNMLKGEGTVLPTVNGNTDTIQVIDGNKTTEASTSTTEPKANSGDLITDKGSTPASAPSTKFKKGVEGDKAFLKQMGISTDPFGIKL